MLATEAARNPLARNTMASYHSRGQLSGSTTSFVSSGVSSRYGSSSTMRSDFSGDSQQGLYPPLSKAMSPPPPDFPKPEQSIMNIRGGTESSLYQICTNLRARLAAVPGFEPHIAEMDEEEADAEDSIDPVTLMWNSLRRGYPLMTVYNALRPLKPLGVDSSKVKEKDLGKAATFKFLQACMSDLKFEASECFLITDLYGEDTTGFVKVSLGQSSLHFQRTMTHLLISSSLVHFIRRCERCGRFETDPLSTGDKGRKQGSGYFER